MRKALKEYVQMIKDFEQKMSLKYNLSENPWCKAGILFERVGSIDGYDYYFHGAGCTLEKKGVICEYDVNLLKEKQIEFSLWKFSEFIRTHPDYKEREYDLKTIDMELQNLVSEGVLSLLEIEGKVFKIYQVE